MAEISVASNPSKASNKNSSRSSFSSSLGIKDSSLDVDSRDGEDGAYSDDDCPSRAWTMAAVDVADMPA